MGFLLAHLLPRLARLDQGWSRVSREGTEAAPPRAPWVVTLGRRHVVETFRRYPINDRRDLLAAIRLDLDALSPFPRPADASVRGWWWIASVDNEGATVNFWFPTPEIAADPRLTGAWLVVPETLLLAHAPLAQGNVLLVAGDLPYFFYKSPATGVVSLARAGLVREAADFLHMAGIGPATPPVRELSPAERDAALLAGWERLETRALHGLWRLPGGDGRALWRQWRRELALGGGIIALYLAGSSYFLHQQRQALEQRVAGFRQEMAELTRQENHLNDLARRHEALAAPVMAYVGRWRALAVLERVMDGETRVQSIRIDRNSVEVTGTTARASELLSRFHGLAEVGDPRFTSPVHTTRDGENFTIRFEVRRPAATGGEHG